MSTIKSLKLVLAILMLPIAVKFSFAYHEIITSNKLMTASIVIHMAELILAVFICFMALIGMLLSLSAAFYYMNSQIRKTQ